MNGTVRVFPRRTAYTPRDDWAFVGEPPLIRPAESEVSEIHISCVFDWDAREACRLFYAWYSVYPKAIVRVGGPAFHTAAVGFTPGMYVRRGIVFTSRGCPNRCPWCLVPEREGKLRLLNPIAEGNVIADNNFLACPSNHRQKVYSMLERQPRAAVFSGGLQASRITEAVAEELRGVRISSVFLAADTEESIRHVRRALERLSFLKRRQLRCYMMLGYDGDTLQKATARLETAWEMGVMPFAQLYQPPAVHRVVYDEEWRRLAKAWSRPAAMMAMHKGRME